MRNVPQRKKEIVNVESYMTRGQLFSVRRKVWPAAESDCGFGEFLLRKACNAGDVPVCCKHAVLGWLSSLMFEILIRSWPLSQALHFRDTESRHSEK